MINQLPDDLSHVPIWQAVGKDILVELGLVVVVTFENRKIAAEHLYWDRAGVRPAA